MMMITLCAGMLLSKPSGQNPAHRDQISHALKQLGNVGHWTQEKMKVHYMFNCCEHITLIFTLICIETDSQNIILDGELFCFVIVAFLILLLFVCLFVFVC